MISKTDRKPFVGADRYKEKKDFRRMVLAHRAICTYQRSFSSMLDLGTALMQLGTC